MNTVKIGIRDFAAMLETQIQKNGAVEVRISSDKKTFLIKPNSSVHFSKYVEPSVFLKEMAEQMPDYLSSGRKREGVYMRQTVSYILRERYGWTIKQIIDHFGKTNGSWVHASKVVEQRLMLKDEAFLTAFNKVKAIYDKLADEYESVTSNSGEVSTVS